jgi:transcriptional regulator with XRE-family HTH domain
MSKSGYEMTPLRRMAAERGFRMDHIARLAGVKPWTLSRIASGAVVPEPGLFERLAVALHCDPDDIRPNNKKELVAA